MDGCTYIMLSLHIIKQQKNHVEAFKLTRIAHRLLHIRFSEPLKPPDWYFRLIPSEKK